MTPPPIPVREPIQIKRKAWATESRLVVMGVDPGFASLGVVILERACRGAYPEAKWVGTVETKKMEKKARSNLRVANDDLRRYREIWSSLSQVRAEYNPCALGVEAYQPGFRSKKGEGQLGRGNAATKTLGVYGGVLFWGFTHQMFVAPFLPSDLKRRFCGRQSASKTDVATEMCKLVVGLEELLDAVPKTKREHVGDAAGHAFLVLEEIDSARLAMGLPG